MRGSTGFGEGQYRLEVAGLKKVWLAMDFCQERREVLALSAGFTLEGPADLDLSTPPRQKPRWGPQKSPSTTPTWPPYVACILPSEGGPTAYVAGLPRPRL